MGCNSLRREIFWGFTYNPGNSVPLPWFPRQTRSLSTKDQSLSLCLRSPSHLFTLWNMGVVEGNQGTKRTRCLLTEAGFLPSERGLEGQGANELPEDLSANLAIAATRLPLAQVRNCPLP